MPKIDTTVLNQWVEQLRSELVSWLNTNKEALATGAQHLVRDAGNPGLTMLFCLFFFLERGAPDVVRAPASARRVPSLRESSIRDGRLGRVRTHPDSGRGDRRHRHRLGAFFLNSFAIPIGVITFFAYNLILGALTSGVIAVLVAAVNGGLTKAIISWSSSWSQRLSPTSSSPS